MSKITFKMCWYTDEYGNRARMWETYVDGEKNDIEICHVCKKNYNEMYGNSNSAFFKPNFKKNSKESYYVGYCNTVEDCLVDEYKTLAEAKQGAIDYLRGCGY